MRLFVICATFAALVFCQSTLLHHAMVEGEISESPPDRSRGFEDTRFAGEIIEVRSLEPDDQAIPVGKHQDLAVTVRVFWMIEQGSVRFKAGDEVTFAVEDTGLWSHYQSKQIGFVLTSLHGRFRWLMAFGC